MRPRQCLAGELEELEGVKWLLRGLLETRLHGAEAGIGEASAKAFGGVATLVEMMIVEEGVEGGMGGLDLCFRSATEEAMPLGELQRVAEHVQLRECGLIGGGRPVLLNIIHCCTPILDLLWCPLSLVQEVIVQILEPSLESREGGFLSDSEAFLHFCCNAECSTALPLDPLADLRPVEVIQVALSTAAGRMDGSHLRESLLNELLREEFAEGIQDDAIADAEEEVEWCRHDALGIDGEERRMSAIDGMLVCRSAVARGGEKALM